MNKLDNIKHDVIAYDVIREAFYLLGWLLPGEIPCDGLVDRGLFHLQATLAEGRYASSAQLAHLIAQRLVFRPRKGFWARLIWLFKGDAL